MPAYPQHILNNPVYSYIWTATRDSDKSFLGIVTGKPRSGKSTSSIRFLYDLDRDWHGKPRFTIDKVVFDPKEFIQELKKDRPRGSGLLWDEVGIGAPRREWYSLRNRLISQVMQTMGFKNRIILLTVPSMTMTDSNVAPLLDFWIQMRRNMSFENNIAHGKFYWTDWNEHKEKLFTVWPREAIGGLIAVYKNFQFKLPPAELVTAYKEKQEDAKNKFLDKADDMIAYMYKTLGKTAYSNISDSELYEIIKGDIDNYLDSTGKVLPAKLMIMHKGLDYRVASRVARVINDEIKTGKIAV